MMSHKHKNRSNSIFFFSVFARYRGRAVVSQILPACGLWGKTLLVAGLAGILLYLSSHLLLHKGQRWELVFLVPAIYTLFKSLGALVRFKLDWNFSLWFRPNPIITPNSPLFAFTLMLRTDSWSTCDIKCLLIMWLKKTHNINNIFLK